MNSGLVDDDHGVFLRLELWSGHKWQIFRLELVFRFVFFEQIPPIRDRRTLFSIMAKVYDESHMSETTPLEESSIPLTDPVERIAAMLTPATASAIERLAKTILTFVHPILLADDASPVFWWSFSIQEVMQIRFLPWQPLPEVVILTLEFFILSHHLNESGIFCMNLPWFLGVAKARMSLGHARKYFQESLPKEVVPRQAEVLVIPAES
jgi:hypothetical protein